MSSRQVITYSVNIVLYCHRVTSDSFRFWTLWLDTECNRLDHICYCSVAKLCLNLCDPHELQHARLPCPSQSFRVCSNSCPLSRWHSLNHLILCLPFLLLPSVLPSIRIFYSELALCIRWPEYWSFSISTNDYSIFQWIFRVDFL